MTLTAPPNWPQPAEAELGYARETHRLALEDRAGAAETLGEFYDPARNFAGRSFLDLQPVDPMNITVSDLLAVSLLNVAATPRAIRRLLDPGAGRDAVLAALQTVDRGPSLIDASDQTLSDAATLYVAVKAALGANPWVVASKLCARKRPALIPVRDRVLVSELRLRNRDFRTDWLVYRELLSDDELRVEVRAAADLAATSYKALDLTDVPDLRLVDTLIWRLRPRARGAA